MPKRIFSTALLLGLMGIVSLVSAQSSDRPADYRQLPDIHIFADTKYGQWAGSGNGLDLETVGEGGSASLPVDESVRFNDLPSYRVSVTGENGWWNFILAGNNWESYSIAPYYPDGALEFDVKGANGGEDFQVAISDTEYGRDPVNLASDSITISTILSITTQWQHVRIPLTTLLPEAASFNLDQIFTIDFSSVDGSAMTIWLNDIKISSPEKELGFPAIKLNQLGYTPAALKTARVTGFAEELAAVAGDNFEVREVGSNNVAYQGSLELWSDFDAVVSGERILAADFSDLTEPGQYYLALDDPDVGNSLPFAIDTAVYDGLLVDTLRYFYLQRSGMSLDAQHAGQFARGVGHPQDASANFLSGTQPPRNVAGGWYDAGDYGKYVNAGATAVSDLLWAFEFFPGQFPDDQLNIPESGNGTPDLLDELRWELDWLLKMQDQTSGGFYHMVQPTENSVITAAIEPRFIEDVEGNRTNVRPTSTTASAVAALAHAAQVFTPFDPDFGATLRAAAESGWTYLAANPDGIAPVPGPYSDDDDHDDRFWAAAALYRLTGDAVYHDYIKQVYQDVETFFDTETDNAYGVGSMGMVGWLSYVYSSQPDPELLAFFEPLFTAWADRMTVRWQDSPWNLTLLDEDFYWGSNYVTLTTPLVMLVGMRALGMAEDTTVVISQNALDYLLGTNPLRFSYISGYGADSLRRPFSQQWSRDNIPDVPKGILAGGPNAYTNPLLYSNFAGKRYVDSAAAWSTNEHTIYWNSTLVFHAALAAQIANPKDAPAVSPVQSAAVPEAAAPNQSAPASGVTAETAAVEPSEAPQPIINNPSMTYIIAALIILSLLILANFVFLYRIWRRIQR
jgi:hypothetical protein